MRVNSPGFSQLRCPNGQGEDIFDDVKWHDFIKALVEACKKTDWLVHACRQTQFTA
jgi:hypothetical protein